MTGCLACEFVWATAALAGGKPDAVMCGHTIEYVAAEQERPDVAEARQR